MNDECCALSYLTILPWRQSQCHQPDIPSQRNDSGLRFFDIGLTRQRVNDIDARSLREYSHEFLSDRTRCSRKQDRVAHQCSRIMQNQFAPKPKVNRSSLSPRAKPPSVETSRRFIQLSAAMTCPNFAMFSANNFSRPTPIKPKRISQLRSETLCGTIRASAGHSIPEPCRQSRMIARAVGK